MVFSADSTGLCSYGMGWNYNFILLSVLVLTVISVIFVIDVVASIISSITNNINIDFNLSLNVCVFLNSIIKSTLILWN